MSTRRQLFSLPLAAVVPGKPKGVGDCAGVFIAALNEWVTAFNAVRPGCIDLREVAAWERLPDLFREVERAHRQWMIGLAKR